MFQDEDPRDFPTAEDEPVFEALPDYNLRADEESTPLYQPGENALTVDEDADEDLEESSLDEAQLEMLEGLLAKAKRLKAKRESGKAKSRPENTPPRSSSVPSEEPEAVSVGRSIEFDFGPISRVGTPPASADPPPETAKEVPAEAVPPTATPKPRPRKTCPGCQTRLPVSARFCYACGLPQPDQMEPVAIEAIASQPKPPEVQVKTADIEDSLELPPLSAGDEETTPSEGRTKAGDAGSAGGDHLETYDLAGLKQDFRAHLEKRITAYFGPKKVKRYLELLSRSNDFQLVRNGSLLQLATWANGQTDPARIRTRIDNTLADLTEYFIVETAAELHGRLFPQRLLGYQSLDWESVDLFKLIMDYLNFGAETETVYTDFVTMPRRAMKNAGKSFLHPTKDERIFFICDQSLISQAKNGFAMTDAALYWKNVLQPAGSAVYTTMDPPRVENGHLTVNGRFFDAGPRLNLKLALLLDRLRRMR